MIAELVLAARTKIHELPSSKVWQTVQNPEDFLGYRIHVRLREDESGGYVGYVAQLRGVVSEGDNVESTMKNVVEAFQACVETYEDEKMPVPWSDPSPLEEDEDEFVVMVKK